MSTIILFKKDCLECAIEHWADAFTCSGCGGASWSNVREVQQKEGVDPSKLFGHAPLIVGDPHHPDLGWTESALNAPTTAKGAVFDGVAIEDLSKEVAESFASVGQPLDPADIHAADVLLPASVSPEAQAVINEAGAHVDLTVTPSDGVEAAPPPPDALVSQSTSRGRQRRNTAKEPS